MKRFKDPYIFRHIVYRFFQTCPLGFKSTSLGKKDFYDVITQNEIRGPRAYFFFVVGKHWSIGLFSLSPYHFLYVERMFEIAVDRTPFGMTKFEREMNHTWEPVKSPRKYYVATLRLCQEKSI